MAGTTKLRSLRVTAEMDASLYARGAQAKVAADNMMISSGDRFGASLANTDLQLNKLPAGMARLSRMWLGGYSEAEKFEKAIRQVGNAIDHGMDLDRAVTMLKSIEIQFGRTANASQLAKQGFVSVISPLATAHVDQSSINGRLGIGGSGKSAAESAAVFQEAAAQQESMAASAKRLLAEIEPLTAAQDRLNAEMMEYRALLNSGAITQEQYGKAAEMSNARFAIMAENIRRTGQHTRLARHEMANLSYQLNDIAVMTASGQAPFMMLMQQGMQIGQLFGGKTLGQAVKGLGMGILSFITNPINLAVVGFASLVAAGAYAFKHIGTEAVSLEDLLKRQKELLDDLKDAYSGLDRSVGNLAPESRLVVEFEARLNIAETTKKIQEDLDKIAEQITPKWQILGRGGAQQSNRQNLPFADVIKELNDALDTGQGDVEKFRRDIEAIEKPTNMSAEAFMKLKGSLLISNDELAKSQRLVNQLSLSLDPLASKLSNLFNSIKARDLIGTEPGFSSLQSFIPDTRSQTEQIEQTHEAFNKLFQTTGDGAEEMVRYQQALEAVNTEHQKQISLANLEIKAIYAKSPAQKADLAAQRERIEAINTGIKGTELDIRAQQAYALAFQTATYAIQEQNKARLQAANDNISSQSLQLELVGANAAEQARLTANLASYLDLQKQAESTGLGFDQKQYELLKAKNAEAARFVEFAARQKLAGELDEERGALGLSDRDAQVRQRLLSSGIAEGTAAWEDFRMEMLRVMEAQDSVMYGIKEGFQSIRADANDFASSTAGMVEDVYNGVGDALVGFIKTRKLDLKSLFDTMIEDVTRFSYKLATSGLMNFMGGGSATNQSGLGGFLGNLFKAPTLYAKGDVFNSPTAFQYGNGKMGVMGEDGPEAVVPLRRGRDGKLGIAGGGSSGARITNTVNNYSSQSTARTQAKDDGNGGIDIVTIIEDVTLKTMSGPKGQSLLSAQYGVARTVRSR